MVIVSRTLGNLFFSAVARVATLHYEMLLILQSTTTAFSDENGRLPVTGG